LNPAQKQLLKEWTAAILWLGLIAIESTNLLSATNTSRILYPIFHFFTGVDPVRFVLWDYYIRKIEWHQTYLTSRTGSLHDVLLDSSAALAAQILLFLLLKPKRTSARQDAPL